MDTEIVECTQGAFYETRWTPLISFKAIRLGPNRFQRCPVHREWEMAHIVPDGDITPEIRAAAERYPASRVP